MQAITIAKSTGQGAFKAVLLSLVTVLWLLAGCNTACKDVDCGPNGRCVEGFCICDFGYESEACSTMTIRRFGGTYSATEICSDTIIYGITIIDTVAVTEMQIIGLHGTSGEIVTGRLLSGTAFAIDEQVVGGTTYTGTATRSASFGTIEITYTADDGNGELNCTAALTPN